MAQGLEDKLVCDDCGEPAQVVVSELVSRECDILCWSCMMKRALAVAGTLASAELEQTA